MIKETGTRRAYGATAAFATELTDALVNSYLAGLKSAKAPADRADEALAQAKAHAQELAAQLNEATGNMLANDRPLGEVFGPDRAAAVGVQEDNVARQRCLGIAAKAKGNGLRWDVDSKPCKECKNLARKIVRPGEAFGIVNGQVVYHAPSHPFCKCSTVEVSLTSKRKLR
jgi:hypothetical protein